MCRALDFDDEIKLGQEDASQCFGGGQLYHGVEEHDLWVFRYHVGFFLGIISCPFVSISLVTMAILFFGMTTWIQRQASKQEICTYTGVSCSG